MLADAVEIAAEPRRARSRRCISIGGVSLALNSATPAHLGLPSSLQGFEQERQPCDIEISITRDVWLPAAPGKPWFDSGAVWKLYQDDSTLTFDFACPLLGRTPYKRLQVDRQFSQARLSFHSGYAETTGFLHAFEYPLDELLVTNRLAAVEGVEVHACGVVDASRRAQLFLGHSGAGKSTTARLWRQLRNARILSDDRIILRLSQDQLWMHGTPWHGEAGFAAADQAPVNAIFVLQHGVRNEIEALPPPQAAAELFARSFVPFHNPEAIATTLALFHWIVERIPCYLFRFLPDRSAVASILNFHG